MPDATFRRSERNGKTLAPRATAARPAFGRHSALIGPRSVRDRAAIGPRPGRDRAATGPLRVAGGVGLQSIAVRAPASGTRAATRSAVSPGNRPSGPKRRSWTSAWSSAISITVPARVPYCGLRILAEDSQRACSRATAVSGNAASGAGCRRPGDRRWALRHPRLGRGSRAVLSTVHLRRPVPDADRADGSPSPVGRHRVDGSSVAGGFRPGAGRDRPAPDLPTAYFFVLIQRIEGSPDWHGTCMPVRIAPMQARGQTHRSRRDERRAW